MSPIVSHAKNLGLLDAMALDQITTLGAGRYFARVEGLIPAPESSHAIAAAIDYARTAQDGEVILIGVSGNGLLDLPAYEILDKQ